MQRKVLFATVLLLPILVGKLEAASTPLEILGVVASASEDGPPASPDYHFLPGDTVYLSFEIAHFALKRNEEQDISSIDLSYAVSLQDAGGVPLTKPISDHIGEQLNPEDKKWLPKRRASFQIPSLVPAGSYALHIDVQDTLAKTAATASLPIRIGGEEIASGAGLSVQQFRFTRDENSNAALSTPAYRPGDTVYTRFDIAGFETSPANEYRVSYGLTVLAPNGKTFIDEKHAATLSDITFYPARYVPVTLDILTKPSSARGIYTMLVEVHDLLGNRTCESKQVFTLE